MTNVNARKDFGKNLIRFIINEAAISLQHFGKSILERNLYLGPLEIILRTLASEMTSRLSVMGDINKSYFDNLRSREYWSK